MTCNQVILLLDIRRNDPEPDKHPATYYADLELLRSKNLVQMVDRGAGLKPELTGIGDRTARRIIDIAGLLAGF